MFRSLVWRVVALVLAAGGIYGCSAAPDGVQPAAALGDGEALISLRRAAFEPRVLTVSPGTTVRWVNQEPISHSVQVSRAGEAAPLFRSPDFGQGAEHRYTFERPGTYQVLCTTANHHLMGMKMVLEVR